MKKIFKKYWWGLLPVVLIILFLINLSVGSVAIPLDEILSILTGGTPSNSIWTDIILDFRLTKAITCILAGSALSLGGLLMQTLFRNPLAGPDVLGLSSGASLAVALVIMAGGSSAALFTSSYALILAASLGCVGIFLIVLAVAQRINDNTALLIIGLMIAAGTSSIVSVLQFVSQASDQQYFLIWTFGSLGNLSWIEIQLLAVAIAAGCVISLALIKSLNGWLLGNFYASSIGVNLKKSRILVIIATCILTGSVTAFCGPIAFIGLAVPHLTRILIDTTNHKILVPSVMMSGACLLLFCDIVSQLPGTTYVLPINALTSLIGAPVVIWVIVSNKKISV
jgi:iron complex transport system permease protein